jgi:hypothetical protein
MPTQSLLFKLGPRRTLHISQDSVNHFTLSNGCTEKDI